MGSIAVGIDMFDDLIREIVRLGFSDKEAAVYVALLRLGNACAPEIAEAAGLSRPTTHDTLEHLGRAGLATAYVEQEQRKFSAEPPERLLNVLHMQRREVSLREDIASRLLPRLVAVSTSNTAKPKIRYIEGIDGLRNMQREYECVEGDIIQLVGYDAYHAVEDRSMTSAHHDALNREGRNRIRSLFVTEKAVPTSGPANVEYRRISPSVINVQGEVTVWQDRVILFSYANGIIAIEIASKTIADTVRGILELAWFAAEKLKTN